MIIVLVILGVLGTIIISYYICRFLIDRNFTLGNKKPRFGLFHVGDKNLGFWVYWDHKKNPIEFYRLKILRVSSNSDIKQESFSFTFPSPRNNPFIGAIELPTSIYNLLNSTNVGRTLLTFQFKTTKEDSLFHDFYIGRIKEIYLNKTAFGVKRLRKKCIDEIGILKSDDALTSTLSYEELIMFSSSKAKKDEPSKEVRDE